MENLKEIDDEKEKALRALDDALCNFINSAGDPYQPASAWDDEVGRALNRLGKATRNARSLGCFPPIKISI